MDGRTDGRVEINLPYMRVGSGVPHNCRSSFALAAAHIYNTRDIRGASSSFGEHDSTITEKCIHQRGGMKYRELAAGAPRAVAPKREK